MSYDDLKTDVEQDRVITYGDWTTGIIYDVLYGEDGDLEEDFLGQFEILKQPFLVDPEVDFYQGAEFVRVIRRKSDDRLFGYKYWDPIGKHSGDLIVEPNGDENGLEHEWTGDDNYCPIFVWLPVTPFTITGFKFADQEPTS